MRKPSPNDCSFRGMLRANTYQFMHTGGWSILATWEAGDRDRTWSLVFPEPLWPQLRLVCDFLENRKSKTENCSQTSSLYSRWEGLSCWAYITLVDRLIDAKYLSKSVSYFQMFLNIQFAFKSLVLPSHPCIYTLVIHGMWKLVDLESMSQGLQCQAEGPPLTQLVSSLCPKSSFVKWNNGSNLPQSLLRGSDTCKAPNQ